MSVTVPSKIVSLLGVGRWILRTIFFSEVFFSIRSNHWSRRGSNMFAILAHDFFFCYAQIRRRNSHRLNDVFFFFQNKTVFILSREIRFVSNFRIKSIRIFSKRTRGNTNLPHHLITSCNSTTTTKSRSVWTVKGRLGRQNLSSKVLASPRTISP